MKKPKKRKSKEGFDHIPDSAEKTLEMIIHESKTKAGAYQKILESFKNNRKEK